MRLKFNPKDQPADFCPRGHGPMWYWPTGGTWACQNVHCGETEPARYYRTVALLNGQERVSEHWLRSRHMAGAMVVDPRPLFTVTSTQ